MKRQLPAIWIVLAVALLVGATAFAALRVTAPRPASADLPNITTTKPIASAVVTPAVPAEAADSNKAVTPASPSTPSKPKPATQPGDDAHETVTSMDDDSDDDADDSDDDADEADDDAPDLEED